MQSRLLLCFGEKQFHRDRNFAAHYKSHSKQTREGVTYRDESNRRYLSSALWKPAPIFPHSRGKMERKIQFVPKAINSTSVLRTKLN